MIKKIVESGKKIICLDITNQYGTQEGLYGYLDENVIQNDFDSTTLEKLEESARKEGNADNALTWGNVEEYKKYLSHWIEGFLNGTNKNVFIMNPDNHKVTKAGASFKIQNSIDVSLVEKVQIISECILARCMSMGQTPEARCCVVYEEAHSLTPEFNSIVVKDDSNHANGTAKVILQGRKYGLGCIIVTQRTANVTKSILNQCNTIFALRVFDDTGKTFLENYIGKDYSDVLPTLEERHAVAIGKGVGLKQPVIIQLNDAKYLKQ